jgi:signal transduction histidine kinase
VELSYRPISLERLMDKVVHSVQAKAHAKTGTTRTFNIILNPPSLEVWADADRLEQILINLVDNAVKYSPPGSTVHIKAEFLPEDDTQIRMSVRDEGAGIPQALLPKIFTKFYRVESPLKQEVEGTGLGLYITKSLTTAMGGQIYADSTPGQGSTFTVILPAATPERQAIHHRRLYASEEDV